MTRKASVERQTRETLVRVSIELNGSGEVKVNTPISLFNHLLETLLYYMRANAVVEASYTGHEVPHHLIEDVGLVLGEAIRNAIKGTTVRRYGWAIVPMDDALVIAAFDYSHRPIAVTDLGKLGSVEGIDGVLLAHFVEALAWRLGATIHIYSLRGVNTHHIVEASFKALGMAMKIALEPLNSSQPFSLKGTLG
ncbi:MAG TPA: imidazoleglycerol-phosphate dehydratase [Pyrodictium sp.]|nr:imidazoleglycerol-phosphate dehydratase [Pyrodictium sp.]